MLAATLALAACGGGGSDAVIARVGTHSITTGTLDRFAAIEAVLTYQLNPTQPVPKGVVPDPPSYADCIAYLAKTPTTLIAPKQHPSTAQLKARCRQKQETLRHHMLDILITNYWLEGEGAARGVAVSDAELNQALDRQFPTQAAFRSFLKITGEKASDERALLRASLMTTKLQQAVTSQKGLTGAQQQQALARFIREFTAKWSARTSCQPGYVVQECKEYKGVKAPI
ncbi:MAG TPA: hypothetical protein VK707_08560 [Solirubrobacteraceae bacterium]|nr:hypothetical protein [Solirubrobacteraceae bacterium]